MSIYPSGQQNVLLQGTQVCVCVITITERRIKIYQDDVVTLSR